MTTIPQPYFTPWKRPRFNGTLILAESCPKGDETQGITGWRAHPDADWPHNFILKHVEEKREQDDATFRVLRQSFLYDGQVLDTFEFWELHGFSNLVPRLMGGSTPERPTSQDRRAAREQFSLILEVVRPRRILIAGAWAVEALKDMSDTAGCVTVGANDSWEMRFGGVPVVGIYHPSAWNRRRPQYTLERARGATARLWNIQ
jgi:hypothetical protein